MSATSGRSAGRPGWPAFSPARPMPGSYLAGQVSGPLAGTFEAIEDQIEPEPVLVAVVVAGREDVLERELGEVRVLVSGEPRQHGQGQCRGFRWSVERQAPLLQREPVDVAVEYRVGVRGQLDREASVPKAPDDGVVVPQRRGTGEGPRLHQADGPAVSRQDSANRHRPLTHGRLPAVPGGRQLDLAEHHVDHAVEKV